jgi:3',5'-cyclic AMP phosphodiesterase CpdA
LLDGLDGTIATLGDTTYESGTADEFARCYVPTWGRHKNRTRPAPGNHEYRTADAAGYYGYFGAAAGDPDEGWYSYDLGTWHVVALNSERSMEAGSDQLAWLQADLAANPADCTVAYWHNPLFSSGYHGADDRSLDVWRSLYVAGVDVVLNGHEHNYERFAPQTPEGDADPAGIHEFIVGTGGIDLRSVNPLSPTARSSTAPAGGCSS